MMNQKKFLAITNTLIDNHDKTKKIGTLQEKLLHRIIKYYFEEDVTFHEIKVGSFYADILKEKEIFEIQTRAFNKLRKKLDCFLPDYKVTIVYPLPYTKWLYWINEQTGEVSNKRKSPKKGTLYDAVFELYKINPYLKHPNLKVCLLLIDMEEYRTLNGWSLDKKKGSSRYNRIPIELIDEIHLDSSLDYPIFLPKNLPLHFTSKDFQNVLSINRYKAQLTLKILTDLECVNRIGKQKNQIIYEKKQAQYVVYPK